MKAIFLDVDGVLNCIGISEKEPMGYIGIDSRHVAYLSEIIKRTGSEVVLTSTWRVGWSEELYERDAEDPEEMSAKYLCDKLNEFGIRICDKVDYTGYCRGCGILDWVKANRPDSYVILDDEFFDYFELGIGSRWVQTEFYLDSDKGGGLQEKHINRAVNVLEKELINERV